MGTGAPARMSRRMAMGLSVLLAFSLLPALPSRAAFELRPSAPAERGCSGPDALGLVEGSVSTVFHPRRMSHGGVLGAYGYRPFGIGEIEVAAFRGRVTLGRLPAGLGFLINSLAAPGYAERTAAVSLGISRGDLWMQPGLRLCDVVAPGIYRGRCILFDLLIYAYVTPKLRLSFDVGNALASGLDTGGGAVPRRLAAGLGFAVSASVACSIRAEKENGVETALATGLEWRAMRGVFIRLGSSTFPREVSLGLGLRAMGLGLDAATTVNFDLGTTHEAGIFYTWR